MGVDAGISGAADEPTGVLVKSECHGRVWHQSTSQLDLQSEAASSRIRTMKVIRSRVNVMVWDVLRDYFL